MFKLIKDEEHGWLVETTGGDLGTSKDDVKEMLIEAFRNLVGTCKEFTIK